MIGVAILGSTGSIGVNTLDVLARHPDRYRVVALGAHNDVDRLYKQCLATRPDYAVLADERAAERLTQRLRAAHAGTKVLSNVAGLETIAALPQAAYVMVA
ncbi:MAG: 1-deoxy-D-xylulose-5-phosphate reductoisomerase, partial [Gammaproteobacteria bacterium]|nr:1-deoxy-D-xylulose-5-phosphate reductoisomerase [Gammaproteobacteria bacterium]